MRIRHLFAPLLAVALAATVWLRWGTSWSLGILALATLLLVLALFAPRTYAPIQAILTRLGHTVAVALAWLLLGLVFLAIFVPGRLLLALRRRDPLQRRPNPARTTYWEPLSPATDPDRFKRQY
jgi:hypothetical protein